MRFAPVANAMVGDSMPLQRDVPFLSIVPDRRGPQLL